MTEMTQFNPGILTAEPTAQYLPPLGTQLIMSAVEQMAGAHQLGVALAGTAFVPRHFQGKPDDVTAAIMYGAAIGLDPMSAVRSIYVVSGTPGLYARSMVAVAMSKGHKIWTEETTDESVTVAGQRRGEDKVERVTWTIERARKAGYTSNAKYNTDPQAMLWARAAGDVARRIAPDALAGLDYSVEELQVIDHVDVATERPKRESAADLLSPAPERAAAASPHDEAASEPEAAPDVRGATPNQVTAINAALTSRDVTKRADKLAWLSRATNRPITSSKDLTFDEASGLIDHFANEESDVTPERSNDEYSDTLPGVEGEVQS